MEVVPNVQEVILGIEEVKWNLQRHLTLSSAGLLASCERGRESSGRGFGFTQEHFGVGLISIFSHSSGILYTKKSEKFKLSLVQNRFLFCFT